MPNKYEILQLFERERVIANEQFLLPLYPLTRKDGLYSFSPGLGQGEPKNDYKQNEKTVKEVEMFKVMLLFYLTNDN